MLSELLLLLETDQIYFVSDSDDQIANVIFILLMVSNDSEH